MVVSIPGGVSVRDTGADERVTSAPGKIRERGAGSTNEMAGRNSCRSEYVSYLR